jgi:predicted Zn-dependent peptidase
MSARKSVAELELITFANGVRVALDPMPGLETAALGVAVRVGARWEQPEENGVAHLFEHMAFKGAGGRDARAFAEAIENVGGYLNASTSFERTSYTARITKEHAPFALELLADMMLAPHWRPEDLELEKQVVAQERGEAFDQPDDRVFEVHQAALFPDQPLGRPILGSEDSVASLKVQSLEAFRAAHTTAERLVISAAGGYSREELLEVAERRFGGLAKGGGEKPLAAMPVSASASEPRKSEQTHLVFSIGGPRAGAEQSYPFWILSEILGGGMASRLFQDVRESRGLVYTIHSWLDSYEDSGRLGVYASCVAKNAAEVAACVSGALEAMAADGPTEAELARAKAVVAAQMLMGAEAPLARAESRASQVFLHAKLTPYAELRARVDRVAAEDVRQAARSALAGEAAAAGVGPKSGIAAAGKFRARSRGWRF